MFPTAGISVTEERGQMASANQPQLDPEFRSKVMSRLASSRRGNEAEGFSSAQDLRLLPPAATGKQNSETTSSHQSLITDSVAMLWLGIISGIGAAFVAGRACLGRLILVLLGARRRPIAEPELVSLVDLLARKLRFSRRVRIVESRRLVSPIAFGLFRPTIGLPLNFCRRFSAAEQEAMLLHELAHLAAHDPFWYFVADLVAAIFWWHPGVWWLRRQLQLSSELAADEASLITADGPRILAACLVEMGAQLARPALGQLRVAGFHSDLGCRVHRLMRLEGAQWTPVSRVRGIVTKSIGPMVIAGTVILCTAWAVPRELTKGDSMKTMKQNWQRALATFATIAAIQTPTVLTAQGSPPPVAPESPARIAPPNPQNSPQPGAPPLERYGLRGPGPANPFVPQGLPESPAHGGRIEGKLREIVLDEVRFDGLPLSEVLNFLGDESTKRDPEKKGINFLLNPNPPQSQPSPMTTIDPATGLPIAGPMESVDISAVSVKFNMPLRHVTMADVLDAIVKVADHPIQYAVEDYAVIFSFRADGNFIAQRVERAVGPAPLVVGTYYVDTNSLVAGLESAFGIKVETKGKGDSQSRRIQSALKELLVQLNVSMEGNKAIFYNELTGTVMVRVALDDLDIIQAAIKTLGGQAMGTGMPINGVTVGGPVPLPPGYGRR
jgi:beta-lactamase regulating signal transducer with metallopeptidase domain